MSRHEAQLTSWQAYCRHRRAYRDGVLRAACRRRARQLADQPTTWPALHAVLRAWPTIELP